MARVALGLSIRDLAEAAQVSTNTIVRLEAGEELKPRTVAALRQALEVAGVVFIPENGGGAGVRLKRTEAFRGYTDENGLPAVALWHWQIERPDAAGLWAARQVPPFGRSMPLFHSRAELVNELQAQGCKPTTDPDIWLGFDAS